MLPLTAFSARVQVALLRSRGRAGDAASKLVEHVEVVCSDTDAWLMLSEIYLQCQQYRRAGLKKLCPESDAIFSGTLVHSWVQQDKQY